MTGHGAKEEKQCGFLEGSLSASLLGTSDITVARGSGKVHGQKDESTLGLLGSMSFVGKNIRMQCIDFYPHL